MSVADDVLAVIEREIRDSVEVDEYGDVEVSPAILRELAGAGIDAFLEPEPDYVVGEEPPPPGNLLGCYVPMRSPGRIFLYQDALRRFFWTVLAEALQGLRSPVLRRTDLSVLAWAVVHKTYEHERLHFSADVLRHLLGGGPRDPLREEALAVAYSRLKLEASAADGRTALGRMSGGLRARALQVMFAYRSPGYRDWRRYGTQSAFRDGLMLHLGPPSASFLVAAGVPVPDILQRLLPIDGHREAVR